MHQFRYGRLNRTVITADDAGVLQLIARIVTVHLYLSADTLADIHHDNIAFGCLAEQIHKPGLLRGIAAPIGAHHNTPKFRRIKHMADQVLLNSGEERKDNHVVVQLKMGGHRLGEVGFQNTVLVESEIDTGFAQMGIIEGVKGIELVRILFRRAVAPEQMAAEIDTYLGDHRRAVLPKPVRCSSSDSPSRLYEAAR